MKAALALVLKGGEIKKATHKGGGDVCRLNFPDNVREEERRYLLHQYDAAFCCQQRLMLQCGYAHAATLLFVELPATARILLATGPQ
ncbi:hypothetical protein [Donghicola tyrosinivorans]|uniref:hypothetical protein n=1 Tax=Donghicola tyrosinivorans TaxID=1652492 RepID=UPI0011B206E4|nr:hypothetical protein [Donghicola tyrosinivorans]